MGDALMKKHEMTEEESLLRIFCKEGLSVIE